MAFYIICGKPACINFAHAAHVAQYLFEHLPNFKYNKIEKSISEWPKFIWTLNRKNKWFMVDSPVIWKEISAWGGKPYLIGGLGEFWEYCYCYYGLVSIIPRADLQKLALDNVKFFQEEQERLSKAGSTFNIVISIFGAGRNAMTEYLLEEFLELPELNKENGYFVKLFDDNFDTADVEQERIVLEVAVARYNDLALFGNRKVAKIVDDEEDAIMDTNLLIMLEDYSQQKGENVECWTTRCVRRVEDLSSLINRYGKRSLKVIFANEGPSCLMASCMVEYCTLLIPANIVVLTADRGLPVINAISEMTGVHISKIGAPPVWGFVGSNEFIDEANILFKGLIFRPYARALTAPKGSTLPLGTVESELRVMSYLVPNMHDDIMKIVQERRAAIEGKLHRKPFLPKLRALRSLVKLWYAEELSDEIISLGVCSDGSYGIPSGIVFSQPSIQDKRRKWRPFPNFPLMNQETRSQLKKIIKESVTIVDSLFPVKTPSPEISILP